MNKKGYFGQFGGQFVPESLMPLLIELEEAMNNIIPTQEYQSIYHELLHDYVGRESPLTFCPNLSNLFNLHLWLKREDLNHTGAHKINNALGQALLAKMMGKTHLIAETGAGQHGVATATAAARLNMDCSIFMGAEDVERQAPNVMRMKLLGAKVYSVDTGSKTLKDAINEALRYWVSHQHDTLYCFGTAAGPHPFPTLVRIFQSIIGQEARRQMIDRTGKLPNCVVACVGGGSNAIGIFYSFLKDKDVCLIGVEAGGTGTPGCHNSASITQGIPGVLHGQKTMLLQTGDGQIMPSESISAGLDYPGVGPEHAYLAELGRVQYDVVYDHETLSAFTILSRKEGIIPALESSHALAWVIKHADKLKDFDVLVNLSGRGDKDLGIIEQHLSNL